MNSKPLLTCERCKRRKIKCDKLSPCTACTSSSVNCEAVQRARLPRGKSGKAHKITLENRVARIETLLKQVQGMARGAVDQIPSNGSNGNISARQFDERQSPSNSGNFVAPDFWNTLQEEVSGLRETFDSSDDEDGSPPSVSETMNSGSGENAMLFASNPLQAPATNLSPSARVRKTLLDLYKQRVDCLYKLLHWPTIIVEIELAYTNLQSTRPPSARALEFAMYFMALCTITDDECMSLNLGTRSEMLQQYRSCTESLISEGNLLRNPDVAVLQAFMLYLVGIRSYQNCASEWTLLAIAVRVASALRLGQENPANFSAFDLQIRRRLWYQVCLLDTHSALDRGTIPMIQYDDLGPLPLEIDDKDMSLTYVPDSDSLVFTEMSFFRMGHMSVTCHKTLLKVSGSTEEAWREKLRIVQEFETTMRQKFCSIDNSAPLIQRLASFSTMEITTAMHLLLRRPPYKQKKSVVPAWDDFDVLKVATMVLDRHMQAHGPEFHIWAWKSWVKWHALAVVLAELLSRPPGPDTERSFGIASRAFDSYSHVIADSESGMLWKPIAKLMRRVRKLRGNTPPTPDQGLPDVSEAPIANHNDNMEYSIGYNINGVSLQEPLPSYEVPTNSGWYGNGDAETAFINRADFTMGNHQDAQLNWDMFLDDFNLNNSADCSNMMF